ncbi:hypothetical protein STCU_01063 [Strigomonas culicis]|uniref:Uncharacterized protein n=1 Tax=Strigomonas culicis TaxID=28005 RepID=S9UHY4_9TRYP|nr:hypothetical protein STCU_05047 [Strigomonas culicis]EPY35611.1 hypothetical protein STCU_01063 [Strigomonas culicis]|eukprot:EPY28533.1 hypothetical protein STCU_05047 [Strigomonas culicis]
MKAGAPQPTPLDRAQNDPRRRSTIRLLNAIQQLQGKNRRRDARTTIQLTEEQQLEVAAQFAATRWYGRVYHPFRNITAFQLKLAYRGSMALLLVLAIAAVTLACYLYYGEVDGLLQLDRQDRLDYVYMVKGMRYSDIYRLLAEVRAREDPTGVLPPPALLHLMLEEARARGWHTMDWEVEVHKMHPRSPLEEMDWIHLTYWSVMLIGKLWSGGNTFFAEDFTQLVKSRVAGMRERANAGSFVEEGPVTREKAPKKSFFSG